MDDDFYEGQRLFYLSIGFSELTAREMASEDFVARQKVSPSPTVGAFQTDPLWN